MTINSKMVAINPMVSAGPHAVVVQFMNFGMICVLLVSASCSYVITKYELYGLSKIGVIPITLRTTLAMAAPHWMWIEEKYVLNTAIASAILALFYKIPL